LVIKCSTWNIGGIFYGSELTCSRCLSIESPLQIRSSVPRETLDANDEYFPELALGKFALTFHVKH